MCTQLTALSLTRFSAWLNRRPTVQLGFYLGFSRAVYNVMAEGDHSLTSE